MDPYGISALGSHAMRQAIRSHPNYYRTRRSGQASRRRRRGYVIGILTSAAALGGTAVFVLSGSDGPARPVPPSPPSNLYLDTTSCLVTDSKGIQPGSPAAAVWAGMQDASAATRIKATYLAVPPGHDPSVIINTFIQRKCTVILAFAVMQLTHAAQQSPNTKFVLIGAAPNHPANMQTVSNTDDVTTRTDVKGIVSDVAAAAQR